MTECRYPKLKGKIIERYGTIRRFAKVMKKTPDTIGNKLNGKSAWKDKDIVTACELLNIPKCETHIYFLS